MSGSHDNDPEESGIYLSENGVPEELWRAVDIALLVATPEQALHFLPANEAIWRTTWRHWLDSDFTARLVPHLKKIHALGADGKVREIAELDRVFGEQLANAERERSLLAALGLMERFDGARHFREGDKYRRLVEAGDCPGHAITTFALQNALFHVSPAATLLGWLSLEWRCAAQALGEKGDRDSLIAATPHLEKLLANWLQAETSEGGFQPRIC